MRKEIRALATERARDIFDSDEICARYREGSSLAVIAKEFRREVKTVKRFLREAGIPIRSAEEQWALMFRSES